MIAIILATGLNPNLKELNERYPTPMLPLVDRPFIQHIIEFLVEEGVNRFEFILSHFPEQIEKYLGDGSRWGSSFQFHLTRNPAYPYETLKTLDYGVYGEQILIVHADRLPKITLSRLREFSEPVAVLEPGPSEGKQWSGWALVSKELIGAVSADLDEEGFAGLLCNASKSTEVASVETPMLLDIRTYEGILNAHQRVLSKEFQGLILNGKEVEDGVWLSRNVSLHPTTKVLPPVYVGENCQIEAGTQLGPHATISHNCVVANGCTVTNAIVFSGSYVGEGLELDEVLVDKNRLINVRLGVAVSLSDQFILGGLSTKTVGNPLLGLLARLVGGALLLLLWPILLLTAVSLRLFRKGPVCFQRQVVRLPASIDESTWTTFGQWSFCDLNQAKSEEESKTTRGGFVDFLLRFIPGLINVVKGEMRLVGVTPRTRDEIENLNDDWKELFLGTKAGLITEAFVQYGDNPSADELFSAEAFYSAMGGFIHDLKLILGYIERMLGRGSAAMEQ